MRGSARWAQLYDLAGHQSGYFTTAQAAQNGFSLQFLEHHLRTGRLTRIQRGIHRLAHFPPGEHDDLIIAWLWSGQAGVLSHGTALALYQLCDYVPTQNQLTVPMRWKSRRIQIPPDLQLFYQDLTPDQVGWYGCVPITKVEQTLMDCQSEAIAYEWLESAQEEAVRRGLILPTLNALIS